MQIGNVMRKCWLTASYLLVLTRRDLSPPFHLTFHLRMIRQVHYNVCHTTPITPNTILVYTCWLDQMHGLVDVLSISWSLQALRLLAAIHLCQVLPIDRVQSA